MAIGLTSACNDGPTAVKITDIVGDWELIHLNRTSATTGETIDAMQTDSGSSMLMTIAVSGNKTGFVLDGQQFYCNIFLESGQMTFDCGEQDGIAEYSRITFIWARP